MKKLHLIMPMGGGGTRFGNACYESPKPLIDLLGKPFFYYATKSITDHISVSGVTFVVLQDHIDRFNIDKRILEYFPEAKIEVIPQVLPGAVLTCRAGVKNVSDDEAIIFNDCDHAFTCSEFCSFINEENTLESKYELLDGALLTFESDEDKFSYAAFDENGYVTRTVEKQVISTDAICGAYYFNNKNAFLSSSDEYLTKCEYKEFFMSGVYNIMCEHGMKIKTFRTDEHISFGTPDEYEEILKSYKNVNNVLTRK